MATTFDEHRSAVARSRAELSKARHLPGDFYTSEAIAEAEREQIFGKE